MAQAKDKTEKKVKKENPHAHHRKRLKKRFLQEGLTGFEEHQALELLLFYGLPQRDTNELAHKYLEQYGSLSNLFEADHVDLMKTLGISEHLAALITLIPQLSQKYMHSRWSDRITLGSLNEAGQYCASLFRGLKYETFFVLCLDAKKKLISSVKICEGSVDEAHVYPRKIVEATVKFQANCIILAHNHPGGTLGPSFSDIETTKLISEILKSLGVSIVDHIIVCGDEYYSFAKNKMLD